LFKSYGDVKIDVEPAYALGSIVSATFVAANPRNNLRLEQTYAAVEKLDPNYGRWDRVRDDSDWGLIFNWKKTSGVLGRSEVEIVWETEEWAVPGRYRVKYYGDSKAVGGKITAFEGTSGEFVLG
jgi:neutral ceramidase